MTLAHREAHAGHQVLQRRDSDGAPYVELYRWTLHIGPDFNPRSLRNFPMQANGAEILRLACCLATERGVAVAGPVHDALVIVAPLDRLAEDAAVTEDAMREASRIVLSGFELAADVKIVQWPDRYMDSAWRSHVADGVSVEPNCKNPHSIGTTVPCSHQHQISTHKSAHDLNCRKRCLHGAI